MNILGWLLEIIHLDYWLILNYYLEVAIFNDYI